jgi:formamidopyrimidine-DNA glycosylase
LAALADRLAGMRRAVKSALLDQRVIAGVGNIYADESLFHAGIHPLSMASLLPPTAVERLAEAVRATLDAAIRAGGSTVRDYVDGTGRSGAYAAEHLVYGRAGEPCRRCGATLRAVRLAQRTTVFCAQCQKRFIARRPGSRSQATASGAPGRRGRTSAAHH